MQEDIENMNFVEGIRLEFKDSLDDKSTKYLLMFDDSCEKIRNSKVFVDIATAGRHRRLSTIYIRYNLIHQNKEGRDDELRNTHILPFKSPRDVMPVNTRNALLGLGSEVIDWYQEATVDLYNHLLTELLSEPNDRLRYCTNS